MSLPRGWNRINEYAIAKRPWMIAKVFVDGSSLYVLSDDSGVRYGHFLSASEAIAETERLDLGAQA